MLLYCNRNPITWSSSQLDFLPLDYSRNLYVWQIPELQRLKSTISNLLPVVIVIQRLRFKRTLCRSGDLPNESTHVLSDSNTDVPPVYPDESLA